MVEYKLRRKVLRVGSRNTGSLVIVLPKIWTQTHGILKGGDVDVVFGDYPFLTILPIKKLVEND